MGVIKFSKIEVLINIGVKYYIYKTTNLINGKYYLGKHEESYPDNYLGSGLLITKAIKKYGKENFKREILEYCENAEQLNNLEVKYITENIINDPQSYNIALGGQGGCIVLHPNHPKYEETKLKIRNKRRTNQSKLKSSFSTKELHKNKLCGMYGKTHSEETKKKMSESAKLIDKSYLIGREVKPETREKLRLIHLGKPKIWTEQSKLSYREKRKNIPNGMLGKNQSIEAKEKQSQMALNRRKLTCVYCGKICDASNNSRWHNENCKYKDLQS